MSPIGQGHRQRDEVLLALLGDPIGGSDLLERLARAGVTTTAGSLLTLLLHLEDGGLVQIERGDGYRFSLTAQGEDAADHVGAGSPSPTTLLMADLVGFVAFTEREGDATAQRTSQHLAEVAAVRLGRSGGRVIKLLGDGVLGTIDSEADPLLPLRGLAEDLRELDGGGWQLRAAAHHGAPIHHRGDLYGRDVNLVARLCAMAQPGEALLTVPAGASMGEAVAVRGFDDPVTVRRELL